MSRTCVSTLILLLALATTVEADAADHTVFGFALGEPLNLPECERTSVGYSFVTTVTCFRSPSFYDSKDEFRTFTILFPSNESPSIVSGGGVLGLVMDRRLEGIGFSTEGVSNQDAVLSALKKKYGEPRVFAPKIVKNRLGASFEAFDAIWETQDLHITFESISSAIDSGVVRIDTRKGKEARDRALKEMLKDRRPL